MQPHGAGSGLDLDHIDFAKARNVLGQGTVKQFHPLRQIANMRPEFGLVPAKNIDAIEPHLARGSGPQTCQQARQRGLAGGRRTDHRQHLTGLQRKGHTAQNRHL